MMIISYAVTYYIFFSYYGIRYKYVMLYSCCYSHAHVLTNLLNHLKVYLYQILLIFITTVTSTFKAYTVRYRPCFDL